MKHREENTQEWNDLFQEYREQGHGISEAEELASKEVYKRNLANMRAGFILPSEQTENPLAALDSHRPDLTERMECGDYRHEDRGY